MDLEEKVKETIIAISPTGDIRDCNLFAEVLKRYPSLLVKQIDVNNAIINLISKGEILNDGRGHLKLLIKENK